MRLFIFGNGFDRAHDLPTSYCQFRAWLIEKYNINLDEEIELPEYRTNYKKIEYYPEDKFAGFFVHLIDDADSHSETEDKWCCFEEDLAQLRWELSLNGVDKIDDGYGHLDIDKTSDNFSIRAQTCGEANHILRTFFREWILWLNDIIKSSQESTQLFFKEFFADSDKYLTFNYTNTLEKLYNIENVCHIHGDISKWQELVFGHCDPGYPEKEYKDYEFNAYDIFQRIYAGYIKDTTKQIKRYQEFFDSIKDVDEIYLFGLSFGEVDLPYFRYIFENCTKVKNVYLNVYNPDEFGEKVAALKSCGAKCKINQWVCEKD